MPRVLMAGACPLGEGSKLVRTREEEQCDRLLAGPAKKLAYASSTWNLPARHSIFNSSSREGMFPRAFAIPMLSSLTTPHALQVAPDMDKPTTWLGP